MAVAPTSGLWRGTSILLAANVSYQLIDFLYRSFMFRTGLIDAETIGLFRVVLPIYLTLTLIAGAGIPTAVGTLVAERVAEGDGNGARRVLRAALLIAAGGGGIAAALLLFGAPLVAERIARDHRVGLALLALAPALLLVSVGGVYRGFYQGTQRVAPVAAAQLVELLTGAAVTLALLRWAFPPQIEYRLAALAAGATAGELFALLALRLSFFGHPGLLEPWGARPAGLGRRRVISRLLSLAAPITLTRLVATVSLSISSAIIPTGLVQAGHDHRQALALFGQLTGMAFYLVSFPHVITHAMAYNLVPEASSLQALRRGPALSATIERSIGLTFAVAGPVAVALAAFPGEFSFLAFGTAAPAAPLLLLAAFSPLLYLEHIMTGILQGLGHPARNLRNFLVAETLSLLLIAWAVPRWGILGAALGTAAGFSLEALADYATVAALVSPRPSLLRAAARPVAASLLMAAALWFVRPAAYRQFGPGALAAVAGTAFGAAVYLAVFVGSLGSRRVRGG